MWNVDKILVGRKQTEAGRKKVLLVASAGGHWVQLSRLSPAFEGYDTLYVTTRAGVIAPNGVRPVAVVDDVSRNNILRLGLVVAQLVWIHLWFRPQVSISTGAAPGFIALWISHLLGARTVWIDSLANSEELSLSGKMAQRCVDLCLTQWPHLAEDEPGVSYFGAVL